VLPQGLKVATRGNTKTVTIIVYVAAIFENLKSGNTKNPVSKRSKPLMLPMLPF
jgi:hypothetical protein